MTRAVDVVRRFGGRAERPDLLRHVTPHELRTALAAGDLVRVARGLYVLADLPDERVLAAACRGVVSHESAAALLGLELLLPPGAVHVTTPRGARPPRRKGLVVHQRDLEPSEVIGDVTAPLRTVLDCCTSLPFAEALAVADSAARRLPDLPAELLAAAEAPGPGRARRLRVARHVDGRAANPFESGLRAILIDHRITGFVPQFEISTAEQTVRVDLADPRRRVVLEADGFAWHGNRQALERDCRRYDDLIGDGWLVLRFSWEQVMFDPEWVVRTVIRTCLVAERSGARPQRSPRSPSAGRPATLRRLA